jgi:hypothetical protein
MLNGIGLEDCQLRTWSGRENGRVRCWERTREKGDLYVQEIGLGNGNARRIDHRKRGCSRTWRH